MSSSAQSSQSNQFIQLLVCDLEGDWLFVYVHESVNVFTRFHCTFFWARTVSQLYIITCVTNWNLS
jgi:hypothetical protein